LNPHTVRAIELGANPESFAIHSKKASSIDPVLAPHAAFWAKWFALADVQAL
jgi:hypothetical protein